MVKLDQQQRPAAMSNFSEHGTYVPRIFMLDSEGSLLADITSGNQRYPFFYSARQLVTIKTAMRKAVEG